MEEQWSSPGPTEREIDNKSVASYDVKPNRRPDESHKRIESASNATCFVGSVACGSRGWQNFEQGKKG